MGVQPECAGCDGRIKSGGLANARYAATLSLSPSARITSAQLQIPGSLGRKRLVKTLPTKARRLGDLCHALGAGHVS